MLKEGENERGLDSQDCYHEFFSGIGARNRGHDFSDG